MERLEVRATPAARVDSVKLNIVYPAMFIVAGIVMFFVVGGENLAPVATYAILVGVALSGWRLFSGIQKNKAVFNNYVALDSTNLTEFRTDTPAPIVTPWYPIRRAEIKKQWLQPTHSVILTDVGGRQIRLIVAEQVRTQIESKIRLQTATTELDTDHAPAAPK